MHTRCPRCQLEFDAVSPWVQCPRCGSPFAAAPLPQPHQQPYPQPQPPRQPQYVPSTQAVDPAMLAQVVGAATFAAPTAAPAYQGQYVPAARPGFVADEDLPGRAALSVVLSVVALLGGCNPVGLIGVTVGLMAYAAANDHRVELARARGRTARALAWASLGITAVVWVIVVLSLFYDL